MSRGAPKRRFRIRRRRRDGSLAGNAADDAGHLVVAEFGCCALEAVAGMGVLAGLMFVPAWLLLS